MFCTKCGKEIKEGAKFCTGCGAPVNQTSASATLVKPAPSVQQPVKSTIPVQQASAGQSEKPVKSKSGKGLIIFLSIIAVLLALGVAFVSFWYMGGREIIYDAIGIETEDDLEEYKEKRKSDDNDKDDDEDDDEDDDDESDKKSDRKKKSDKKKKGDEVAVTEEEMAIVAPVDDAGKMDAPVEEAVVDEAPVEEESEYILEDSDKRRISESDLRGFSADDCRIARNEIYARHGRLFDDEELQSHFNQCSWYDGYISGKEFREDMLSDIEMENRDTIIAYEKKMGYR